MSTTLITGANRGIGLELARQCLDRGDDVIACARNPDAATDLRGLTGSLSVEQMDPGDPVSIESLRAKVGNQAIDTIINNAGALGGFAQSLADLDLAAWHDTLNVNTIGPLLIARAFQDNLAASGNGQLMNVTSQVGASTWPMGGNYVYASTKAALNHAMRALAIDWSDQPITVALIHPGWVRTDMGGPKAAISAEESATGILNVLGNLTKADSGKFYAWNGDAHAW